MDLEDLDLIEAGAVVSGSYSDFAFTDNDLALLGENKTLFVPTAMPGGFAVIDNNGFVINAPQKESIYNGACEGTYVMLDEFLNEENALVGIWKIRYNRGIKGDDATSETAVSDETMLLYSIIFN